MSGRKLRTARRWLAVGLYLGALSTAAAAVAAGRVSAALGERTLALGHHFGAWQQFAGRVTDVTWNGQHLSVSTLTLEQPLTAVLSHFVGLCESETRQLAADLARRLDTHEEGEVSALQRALVLRDEISDRQSAAVCLAGAGRGGLPGLFTRVRAFARSSDLSDIGQFRYVYARRVDVGTHVIFVAADGPLRLDRLFPLEGQEADGAELVQGVRPRASVRLIAARALGTSHALTAYHSTQPSAAVFRDYGRQLQDNGFIALDERGARAERLPMDRGGRGVFAMAYVRGDQTLIATSQPDEEGSLLSVVQLSALPVQAPWRTR